jgi:CheY-like chemotaxis protein
MEIRNAASAPLGRGETILVVEDNNEIRTLAAHQLRRFGYSVIEATDPADALAILHSSQHVDLLFTDVVMPGSLSGPDLAEQAKALRPHLKVLFTSGFPDIRSGGCPQPGLLLSKPYRSQELARKLHEALQGLAP